MIDYERVGQVIAFTTCENPDCDRLPFPQILAVVRHTPNGEEHYCSDVCAHYRVLQKVRESGL